MKYTNYILSDKVININAIQTKNPVLVLPMAVIGIPIVFLGFLTILFALPAAIAMDQQRKLKYFLIRFERINNYQYGSQTHINNLLRDYIRVPYLLYLGSHTSRAGVILLSRKEKWRNRMPRYYTSNIMDNILSNMGRNLLVVKNPTHSREYG